MQVGLNLPVMVPGLDRERILEWARRIDAGPYSSLAAGERITFPNPEITVALSAAAAVTTRVRIFFNAMVLPLHSAVLKAKELATLDVISAGRLMLAVGAGAREEDFRALGAPFKDKRLGQLEAQVQLMRRVWAGELVVEGARRPVEPLPLQAGGPEVLSASIYPGSIRRAARWADGIAGFSFGPSTKEVQSSFETARAAWKDAGRASPPRLVTSCFFALGPEARNQMDQYLQRYLAFMGPGVARKIAAAVQTTSAKALRAVVRELADVGTDELSLVPTTLDPDEVERVADLLG